MVGLVRNCVFLLLPVLGLPKLILGHVVTVPLSGKVNLSDMSAVARLFSWRLAAVPKPGTDESQLR